MNFLKENRELIPDIVKYFDDNLAANKMTVAELGRISGIKPIYISMTRNSDHYKKVPTSTWEFMKKVYEDKSFNKLAQGKLMFAGTMVTKDGKFSGIMTSTKPENDLCVPDNKPKKEQQKDPDNIMVFHNELGMVKRDVAEKYNFEVKKAQSFAVENVSFRKRIKELEDRIQEIKTPDPVFEQTTGEWIDVLLSMGADIEFTVRIEGTKKIG